MKSISFLTVILFVVSTIQAQDANSFFSSLNKAEEIPYGNNPKAGSYFDAGGVKLYYEIYGEGEPLLMLHGGIFGYIDEFGGLIEKLSENYKVICLATRGHGKSEIGDEPFTWEQRANDAYQLLKHLRIDSTIVLGFSDGGNTALEMASVHPNNIIKLIVIGAGENLERKPGEKTLTRTSTELLAKHNARFTKLLKLMPEPERWDTSLEFGSHLYNEDYQSKETYNKITCPVLLVKGDKDNIDNVVQCYKNIPNAKLAIIPGCGHVVFWCNFKAVYLHIEDFLK